LFSILLFLIIADNPSNSPISDSSHLDLPKGFFIWFANIYVMKSESSPNNPKKTSSTKSFGVSERRSHDASAFYSSRLYEGITAGSEVGSGLSVPDNSDESGFASSGYLNQIYCKSSEIMDEIPDNSVHLMVTSPPYNVTKEYDDNLTLPDYLELLERVFAETYRKLADGGRACVNIANLGRKPYIPMHSHIIGIMDRIGYLMRGEIIWEKGASSGGSCAWGSWKSASNPVLRDTHEYILIYSKGSFLRKKTDKVNTITRDEFLEYTKSVWTFPTVSAKKARHPAPFPEELPYRLIQLYTYKEDTVLDPFCGSGTTCAAAHKTGRNFIGYDTKQEYAELARERIARLS
jgi:site-specific DNA-methyltransferase (adenine-specific)